MWSGILTSREIAEHQAMGPNQTAAAGPLSMVTLDVATNMVMDSSLPARVLAHFDNLPEVDVTKLLETTYLASDPSIFMVDSSGIVTALKEGQATLTVTYQGKQDSKTIHVTPQVCVVPPSGLIALWTGDNTFDNMMEVNNATPVGDVGFAPGKVGPAFYFDGSGSYVQVQSPSGLPIGNAARTIHLWFKTSKNLIQSTESALVQYGSTINSRMFALVTSMNNPGKLHFYGHNNDCGGTSFLQPNLWYHGAVTFDGLTLKLYLNGRLENSMNAPSLDTALDRNGLTIGYRPDTKVTWAGSIDEVAIFNRALSDAEIFAIYSALSAGMCRLELAVSRLPNSILLSWSTNYAGFDVESCGQLPPIGKWTPFMSAHSVLGNQNIIIIPTSTPGGYYRLTKP